MAATSAAAWNRRHAARAGWSEAPARKAVPAQAQLKFLAGDWYCKGCGDHQFARNAICRRCGAARQADASAPEKGSHDSSEQAVRSGQVHERKAWNVTSPRSGKMQERKVWNVQRKAWQQKAWSYRNVEDPAATSVEGETQEAPGLDATCPDSDATSPGSEPSSASSDEEQQVSALELLPPPGLESAFSDTMPPPPGLEVPMEVPPGLGPMEQATVNAPCFFTGSEMVAAPAVPDGYQVLLRGYPEELVYAFMLHDILADAEIDEQLLGVSIRPGGKVLLAFATLESVRTCIRRLNGVHLDDSGIPVKAIYVQTVQSHSQQLPNGGAVSVPATQPLSDDSGFAAGDNKENRDFVYTTVFSADASEFVPASVHHDAKPASDASTGGGDSENASEGVSSEAEDSTQRSI